MKTSELTGAALDWAVAKCEGELDDFAEREKLPESPCYYSTDWSQGGPIIEREKIHLSFPQVGSVYHGMGIICRTMIDYKAGGEGPTPLIAAMRAFVASKLGDEVDVPKELL